MRAKRRSRLARLRKTARNSGPKGLDLVMNPELVSFLEQQDKNILAVWWCILNHGKWPRELEHYRDPQIDLTGPGVWRIMSWIDKQIGYKECLRVWNDERMSREDFEKWWEATGLGKN